jgi:DNA-binding NarL/FixJ family response regulator
MSDAVGNRSGAPPISVLIADDHPIFRQGLRRVLEGDPGVRVAAEAGDGEEALSLLRSLAPHVAVLDVDMPRLDGLAVARTVRAEKLATGLIVLSLHKDEDMVQEALNVGVRGYVVKDSAVAEIGLAVRAVAAGQRYFSPAVASHLVHWAAEGSALREDRTGLAQLTPAERRILRAVAEGKTSREISEALFVSPRTVENHRANICQKLDLKGSHALLKFALEHRGALLGPGDAADR